MRGEAALEATGNYFTIYDTLDEYLDVVVTDPNQTRAWALLKPKPTGYMRSCWRSFSQPT